MLWVGFVAPPSTCSVPNHVLNLAALFDCPEEAWKYAAHLGNAQPPGGMAWWMVYWYCR